MTKLQELDALGQSMWYDNIERGLITSGELKALIDAGIRGITSNPSIFQKAISSSEAYTEDLQALAEEGKDTLQIYEALAIDDIQQAADLLYPIYEETDGKDGFVSLEVNPTLAHDTDGTIAEARRLFATVGRPNTMIKVPATQAGIPAITTLIGDGVNINVTLLFANDNYEQVARAYIAGLEDYALKGGDISRIASVASFFVSRVDSIVDKALEAVGNKELQGKIAIANAKVAYTIYEELFDNERWSDLAAQGARPQRLLWASTSTKNPAYPDTMYIDELIGPNTVNTAPPATVVAFEDHGTVAVTLTIDVDEARRQLAQLETAGIHLDTLTDQLQTDGVEAFSAAFKSLLASIDQERRRALAADMSIAVSPGKYEAAVEAGLGQLAEENLVERIWAGDYTVWKPDPKEITNRLGWLAIADEMLGNVERLNEFVDDVRGAGYRDVVLLGMGGSSLAPEVFSKVFGTADGYLNLTVVDSTDPGMILEAADGLDLSKSLFIVATKSGGTAETLSMFKYFYNQVAAELGLENAGEHFVAITDPGSSLIDLAQKYDFREIFLNNPNIGGRYSALSYFGLLPAALIGVDLARLLDQARIAMANGQESGADATNVAAVLGVVMGKLALKGVDKLTLITSPSLASFGDWVEQLIAESTGKEGKGILPVVGEAPAAAEEYSADRLFVYLKLDGENTYDKAITALEKAERPLVRLLLANRYELGRQFFLWELATAVAGACLGIQPFDQPNVESAKVAARKMIAAYLESGSLPESDTHSPTAESLKTFLQEAQPGDYVSIQAYIKPSAAADAALDALRLAIRQLTGLPVTVGYGPRFLHSTGQLHKGDGGNGFFIQLTGSMPQDISIPDEAGKTESGTTFGVLITAQALGDAAALREAGRRVIHYDLGDDIAGGIATLSE
ncbi:MAG: bifunctional transaldolase/phosoglucose isomerase [Candidatus Promineifilaceae bacterium]|jgi:transaldolase/glucose-6-phosphate isomerase